LTQPDARHRRLAALRRDESGHLVPGRQRDRGTAEDPAAECRLRQFARGGQVARARHADEPLGGRQPAHLLGGVDEDAAGGFEVGDDARQQGVQRGQAARPQDVDVLGLRYARAEHGRPVGEPVPLDQRDAVESFRQHMGGEQAGHSGSHHHRVAQVVGRQRAFLPR